MKEASYEENKKLVQEIVNDTSVREVRHYKKSREYFMDCFQRKLMHGDCFRLSQEEYETRKENIYSQLNKMYDEIRFNI